MEENRPVKKREIYKRVISFFEGFVLLAIEVVHKLLKRHYNTFRHER